MSWNSGDKVIIYPNYSYNRVYELRYEAIPTYGVWMTMSGDLVGEEGMILANNLSKLLWGFS